MLVRDEVIHYLSVHTIDALCDADLPETQYAYPYGDYVEANCPTCIVLHMLHPNDTMCCADLMDSYIEEDETECPCHHGTGA